MPDRTRLVSLISLFALLFALTPSITTAAPVLPAASAPRGLALERLQAAVGGDVAVSIKPALGVATSVRLAGRSLAVSGEDAESRARAFLSEYRDLFGIRDVTAELTGAKIETDVAGNLHVAFVQRHAGLAVFGGSLRVHMTGAGRITGADGVFVPGIDTGATAVIQPGEAERVAVEAVTGANKEILGAPVTVLRSELLVYRTGLAQNVPGENRLAFRIEAGNGEDVRDQVFVDAVTGAVLDRFPMIDNLYREVYARKYDPKNLVWKEGQAWPTDVEYQNVASGAGEIYNLIGSLTNGGWLSYNGGTNAATEAKMISVAKYFEAGYCPNASWNGSYTRFCSGVSGDDTVAHEWGHAYTEYTHNLIYAWQPGALNESYSDIWGEIADLLNGRGIDSPDAPRDGQGRYCSLQDGGSTPADRQDNSLRWVSGEDDPGFGDPIRDMWRPECHDNPGKVTSSAYYCSTGDGGGVHYNSGVPNHGFALLVDGGTYNGQTITGLGLTKAAHLYWQAQRFHQTNTSDFADHADALEASCTELIDAPLYALKTTGTGWGATTPAITQSDCDQVSKAIQAVEFRTPPTCSFAPMFATNPPPLCSNAGEGPQNHLFETFESGLGAWTTQQSPVNASTWTSRPWTATAGLPDGRTGQAAFGPDPIVGDCSADLENGITSLLSPVINVAGAPTPIKLAWDHWVSMEIDYDGGNLKASINGGLFTVVPASAFIFNPYNSSLAVSQNDNPMAGEAAWTGGDGGAVTSQWGQSQVNVSALSPNPIQTVQFKWDVGSDGCNGWKGWYVDDVRLYSCSPCATPDAPAGLTITRPDPATVSLSWAAAAGASGYEVWTAENTPYFDLAGLTCTNPGPYTCTAQPATTYTTAPGNPGTNHAYLVRSVASCGTTSAISKRTGEFAFGLTPGN